MFQQWNDGLAKMADRWARRCQFVHNSRRNNQSMFNFVGENLAYSSGKYYTQSKITADIFKLNFTFSPKKQNFNLILFC